MLVEGQKIFSGGRERKTEKLTQFLDEREHDNEIARTQVSQQGSEGRGALFEELCTCHVRLEGNPQSVRYQVVRSSCTFPTPPLSGVSVGARSGVRACIARISGAMQISDQFSPNGMDVVPRRNNISISKVEY